MKVTLLGVIAFLGMCFGAAVAPAAQAQTEAQSESNTPPVIPDDAELERLQAKIGAISVRVDEIFDQKVRSESGAFYRLANRLHTDTRTSTVLPQLLFKTGEPYSRRILAETERNLRARRYLVEANIAPVRYDADSNTVDLEVRVRDVWTLNPGASFGRAGGVNHSGIQIEDSNFLGLGKSIAVERTQDVDRNAWKVSYHDQNVLGSRWELGLRYGNASDGDVRAFNFEHPFYSWATTWSFGVNAQRERRVDTYYSLGEAIYDYKTEQSLMKLQAGFSSGLQGAWVNRWRIGYTLDENKYTADPVSGTLQLPENKKLAYPWIGFERSEDRYLVDRNRDQSERTEDIYLGRSFALNLGYAAPGFGADRSALMFDINAQGALQFTEAQILRGAANLHGRVENGWLRGTVLGVDARYDLRQSPRWLFTTMLSGAVGTGLDVDQQILLGGDNGLRGYPLRYLNGTARTLFSVEQRYYTQKNLLGLLSIGAAAFFDIGRVWANASMPAPSAGTLKDIGVGLRLGNLRSSMGEVFHLDMAYPLDGGRDIRKLQFSVITKHSF